MGTMVNGLAVHILTGMHTCFELPSRYPSFIVIRVFFLKNKVVNIDIIVQFVKSRLLNYIPRPISISSSAISNNGPNPGTLQAFKQSPNVPEHIWHNIHYKISVIIKDYY